MGSSSAIPVKACNLHSLSLGMAGLTPALGTVFAEAAAVCLEHKKHTPGVHLTSEGDFECTFALDWARVTEQQRRAHNDLQYSTEYGAYGVAIFLIKDQTGKIVIERSRKGTGFDFWLGEEDDFLFQQKARLEVSGILDGSEAEMGARAKTKLKQISRSDGVLPGYIAIVEFSGPKARILTK